MLYFLFIDYIITICLGLISGIVRVTGEKRLQMSFGGEEDRVISEITDNHDTVKEDIYQLIQQAATCEGLVNMRVNPDQSKLFDTFVNYCLVNFTTSLNWRYKSYNTNISDIFTESDESLCMLILENNATDFLKVYTTGSIVARKESKTKYTKSKGNVNAKFKGWNRNGIKRFNFLIRNVKKNRSLAQSHELEIKLKEKYEGICKDSNQGNTSLNDSEHEDVSSDEDVDAYDGFAGDDILTETEEETIVSQSNNITGV